LRRIGCSVVKATTPADIYTLSLHDALPISADESILGTVPHALEQDLEAAVTAAIEGFRIWRRTSPAKRCEILTTAAALMRERLRSEEHTSELQSRENLVCRLLLEKKKELEI